MTTKQLLLFLLLITNVFFTTMLSMYHPDPFPGFFFIRSHNDLYIRSGTNCTAQFFPLPNTQGIYQYPAPCLIHYKPRSINPELYQKYIQETLEINSNTLRAMSAKEEAIAFYRQRIGILTDSYAIELIKLNSGK